MNFNIQYVHKKTLGKWKFNPNSMNQHFKPSWMISLYMCLLISIVFTISIGVFHFNIGIVYHSKLEHQNCVFLISFKVAHYTKVSNFMSLRHNTAIYVFYEIVLSKELVLYHHSSSSKECGWWTTDRWFESTIVFW